MAFEKMKKWIERGVKQVPDWLMSKYRFKKDLTRLLSVANYEQLIIRYGINYIITPSQVDTLLTSANVDESTINFVKHLGKKLKNIINVIIY